MLFVFKPNQTKPKNAIKKNNKKERLEKKVYVYNCVYNLFKNINLKY